MARLLRPDRPPCEGNAASREEQQGGRKVTKAAGRVPHAHGTWLGKARPSIRQPAGCDTRGSGLALMPQEKERAGRLYSSRVGHAWTATAVPKRVGAPTRNAGSWARRVHGRGARPWGFRVRRRALWGRTRLGSRQGHLAAQMCRDRQMQSRPHAPTGCAKCGRSRSHTSTTPHRWRLRNVPPSGSVTPRSLKVGERDRGGGEGSGSAAVAVTARALR